jgi:hypothetical protein
MSYGVGFPSKDSLADPEAATVFDPVRGSRALRSAEDDHRVAVHESGHATVARLLGVEVGGVAIESNGSFGGAVYGLGFFEKFCDDTDDLTGFEFCTKVKPLMPLPGESRDGAVADVHMHSLNRLIEVVAGSVAETMLLGNAWPAESDRAQAQSFANLICSSPESTAALIALAESMCRDLLEPHLHVVTALAAALRIERVMDGAGIDQVIATALAKASVEEECCRRADWRGRSENAAAFRVEKRASPPPHAATKC